MLLEVLYQCSNGRCFLTDSYIDTIYWLASLIEALLVDDGIHCDGSFTGLTVTDDQLTLSTTDRNHRVYRLQTSLKRFLYWLTIDYTRCLTIQRHLERIGEVDVTQTINSLPQRVYDTSEEVVVYADRSNTVCTLHALSLLDASCRT